jgi:hypothetical protein
MFVMELVRHATERCNFIASTSFPNLDCSRRIGRHGKGYLGDAQIIARNQASSSIRDRENARLAFDMTDQGLQVIVEPVTHTGTSEGTGNCIRADERE